MPRDHHAKPAADRILILDSVTLLRFVAFDHHFAFAIRRHTMPRDGAITFDDFRSRLRAFARLRQMRSGGAIHLDRLIDSPWL
jgi:hypothetical protein